MFFFSFTRACVDFPFTTLDEEERNIKSEREREEERENAPSSSKLRGSQKLGHTTDLHQRYYVWTLETHQTVASHILSLSLSLTHTHTPPHTYTRCSEDG